MASRLDAMQNSDVATMLISGRVTPRLSDLDKHAMYTASCDVVRRHSGI